MLPSAAPLAIQPLGAMSTARQSALDRCIANTASTQSSLLGCCPLRRSCNSVSQASTLRDKDLHYRICTMHAIVHLELLTAVRRAESVDTQIPRPLRNCSYGKPFYTDHFKT